MPSWRHIMCCFTVFGAILLGAPAVALATGAGDQQYIDPLAGSTTQTSSPAPSTSHPSAPSSTPAPATSAPSSNISSSPTATVAAAPASAQSSANTSAPQSTSSTLPYTGLNAWLCAAVGFALVGAGCAVRRLTRPA